MPGSSTDEAPPFGVERTFAPDEEARIALAEGAGLRFEAARAQVVVDDGRGGQVRLDAPELAGEGPLHGVASRSGRHALLARREGEALALVDAAAPALRMLPIGERLQRVEQLALAGLRGVFVVITENGLAVISEGGEEHWRIQSVTYDWRLVGEHEGRLFVSDGGGNLLAFDLETGREAET